MNLNRVSILDNEAASGSVLGGDPNMAMGGGLAADAINGRTLLVNVTNSVIAGNKVTAATAPELYSGGGGVWDDGATVNLNQTTLADNTVPTTNTFGSGILVYGGAVNVGFSIIANQNSGSLAAVEVAPLSDRNGSLNITQPTLFSNNVNNGAAGTNVITGDAKFVNAAGGNYNLQAGSAAIDKAVGSSATVDLFARLRVGTPDLGALEFGTATTPTPRPPGSFDKLGAFRALDGSWSLDSNGNLAFDSSDQVFLNFGGAGRTGVAGDWENTGFDQIGDFNAGECCLDLDLDNNGVFDSNDRRFFFGQTGDVPIVGNFYGTGTRIGVFRAAPDGFSGQFLIDQNGDEKMDAGDETFTFGIGGDRIVIGDWTGDGKAKIGVFRDASAFGAPGAAVFTLDLNNNHAYDPGVDQVFIFGLITDGLVIGDWNGNGIAKVGVYRDGSAGFNAPGVALFSLDTNGNRGYDAGVDSVFLYGFKSDQFLAGNWVSTLPPAQFAADGRGPGNVPSLTEAELTPVLNQALADWEAHGASAAQFANVQVQIGQLDGGLVGWTAGKTITLDADAAGWGWSIVLTGPTPGKMDLLTVVEHELGHELGLPDDRRGGLMDALLPTGTRRSP